MEMAKEQPVPESIENEFARIWPAHVENFTWHLIQCRRHFSGDMDRLLVLCVIGDRIFFGQKHARYSKSERLGEHQRPEGAYQSAVHRRFQRNSQGTVRRKLQDLTALGWVERDQRGNFAVTPKAAADLAPLTEIAIKYLAKMKAYLSPE